MAKLRYDQTLTEPITLEDVGLHSGEHCRLQLLPTQRPGFLLRKADQPSFLLRASEVISTQRCTDVTGASTLEHVLAALFALKYTAVECVLEGPEFPILDGSALPLVRLLRSQSPLLLASQRAVCTVKKAFSLHSEDCVIQVTPSDGLLLSYELDYPLYASLDGSFCEPLPGSRLRFAGSYSFEDDFDTEIAPARTFVFERDIAALKKGGQALGGTLENALVLKDSGEPLNNARFSDEPLRHKLLDLLGDLALLGADIQANIHVRKGGHTAHVKLVQALAQRL